MKHPGRLRDVGTCGTRVFAKRAGVEAGALGDEVIVLDSSGTMLRGLNHSAGRVLELIDGARDVSAITRQIAAEFDIPEQLAESDICSFLEALASRKLIEPRGGGACV